MKKIALVLATLLFQQSVNADRITSDTVTVGKPTVSNKKIEFDIGAGSVKPSVRANSSTQKLEFTHDGTTYKTVGSGGSAGRNYLEDWFDTEGPIGTIENSLGDTDGVSSRTSPTQWGAANTSNLSLVTTASALRGAQSYITNGSGNSGTGGLFVETPAYVLDTADVGKPIFVSFEFDNAGVDGDWDVVAVVRNSSNVLQRKVPITGTLSAAGGAKIPLSKGQFSGAFVGGVSATDKISLRFRRLANSAQLKIDSLAFGPQPKLIGVSDTGWVNADLTAAATNTQGLGSPTYNFYRYRVLGDTLYFQFEVTSGSATNVEARFPLPTGYESQLVSSIQPVGYVYTNNGGSPSLASVENNKTYIVVTDPSNFSTKFNGTTVATSGWVLASWGSVPVKNANSSTQAVNRALQEYAANDGTNDVFGLNGASLPTITLGTGTTTRDFVFPSTPNDVDSYELEVKVSAGYPWVKASSYAPFIQSSSTDFYGLKFEFTSGTSARVTFGNRGIYSNNAGGFGNNGVAWTNISAFRAVKVKSGGMVGFPVGSRNLLVNPPTSSTDDVPEGFLGHSYEMQVTSSVNAASTGNYLALASVDLKPGKYIIMGSADVIQNGSTLLATGEIAVCVGLVSASSSGCVEGISLSRSLTPSAHTADYHNTRTVVRPPLIVSTPTTVYLNVRVDYTAGTPKWQGHIYALAVN